MKKIAPIPFALKIQSQLNPSEKSPRVRIAETQTNASGTMEKSLFTVPAKHGRITAEATFKKATLDTMLERFIPAIHGGESMAYPPLGKEVL